MGDSNKDLQRKTRLDGVDESDISEDDAKENDANENDAGVQSDISDDV